MTRDQEQVFLNSRDRPWTTNAFQRRFRTLREITGVSEECVPYSLRHSFGTRAIENGVDLLSLSKLMGHSSTAMTTRYCHLSTEFLREQMRKAMG